MAFEEATGFCKTCSKQTLVRREKANHILHFLISFFTCGAWAVVWILVAVKIGGWRCSTCGSLATRKMLG
jgi:hypothetical protein